MRIGDLVRYNMDYPAYVGIVLNLSEGCSQALIYWHNENIRWHFFYNVEVINA